LLIRRLGDLLIRGLGDLLTTEPPVVVVRVVLPVFEASLRRGLALTHM
jgi:hypothetical protein